jgi:hypothetical protein
MLWKRPSFWTAIVAVLAYWDNRALNGGWVYDDAGSVIKNIVVNGQVDWKEAFTRDFWGVEMKEAQSHKSFRPITTLTLKLNYLYGQKYKKEVSEEDAKDVNSKYPPTYSFHLVNILLHGVVTGLITEATSFILGDVISQLIVGFLFGLHPAHAEVVSNITSRGELLMSLFSCIAFLSYASNIAKTGFLSMLGVYIVPWLCMTLSVFSKEQGATTLIALVLYDFLLNHGNVVALGKKMLAYDSQAWSFTFRTVILAIQTIVICGWRYILNGETSPDFIEAQNPAGFAKDRFTRAFSVSWVYCLYIRDALYPYYLCSDWSGLSIDLITSWTDPRAMFVLCLWYFAAASFWSMVVGGGNNTLLDDVTLRKVNMATWAFTFSPFLLSSNLLVVVGLMKADRVIYLPLFGFCLLEALLLSKLLKGTKWMYPGFENRRKQEFWGAHFFLMFQLIIFSGKTHERNLAWSDPLLLWESAYRINPRSHHTMYNYGYELSIRQRYEEAELVMRPIGDPRVEGPSNTFVYAMILFNLKKCDEANRLMDYAFEIIEEKRRSGGVRDTASSLGRTESNLLVARAHCTEDFQTRGGILYDAVQADPSNDYAIGLATQFMQSLEKYEKLKQELL